MAVSPYSAVTALIWAALGVLLGRAALAKELPAQACGTPVSILAPEGGGRTDGQMPELPAGQENPDWTALGQEPVL